MRARLFDLPGGFVEQGPALGGGAVEIREHLAVLPLQDDRLAAGGRASNPPKRSSTYESQSPPLVYSPSLITSMPISRWRVTTFATILRSSASSSPPGRSVP